MGVRALFFAGWLSLLTGLAGTVLAAQASVAVVVSSNLGPYAEALAGALESLEPGTLVLTLANADRLPPEIETIVAIGGKAALHAYPHDVQLVYCLAPGIIVAPSGHVKRSFKVYVSPPPRRLLQIMREMQPNLLRLGMPWISNSGRVYAQNLALQAKTLGITVIVRRAAQVEDLPDALRSLYGSVDALWIAADPALIAVQPFATLSQFSLSNKIPLYVPMAALAEKGAVAAIAVSFRSMGQKAGALAAELAARQEPEGTSFYGEPVTLTINTTSAGQLGLVIEPSVQKRAERILL